MRAFLTPRFLLLVLGAVGAIAVLYVIVAASVKPDAGAPKLRDPSLLTGEVAKFQYALQATAAPDIPFEIDGAPTSLGVFRGKVVLVNFWATWCPPCLEELPSLDRLQGALGGEDFQVVAIAADARGPEVARRFLDRLGIENLALYQDPRLALVSSVGGANVLPVSILYDRRGREIGRLVGEADWQSPEARALITNAIAASPR
ncbi:MAG: TlpA family protein disulfide reductase [Parvularculaceae bacterium]|nr:TlpA family protein disulfide reductase [Parvularculaceae bacterium]